MRNVACLGAIILFALPLPGADTATAPQPTPQGCVKRLFKKFCLGASKATLPPGGRQRDRIVMFASPSSDEYACEIVDGRIATVLRLTRLPSWLKYRAIEGQLEATYGPGLDTSQFPEYSETDAAREVAIFLEKGEASHVWKPEGFFVRLSWGNRENISLAYAHNELQQRESKRDEPEL